MVDTRGGIRSRTRQKLRKKPRQRGKLYPNKVLQEFKVGDKVRLLPDPMFHKGMPLPRNKNAIGTITERRGNAYVVEISDLGKKKLIISLPIHLKKV